MRIVLERTAAQMATKDGAEAEFDMLVELNNTIQAKRHIPSLSAAINQDFHRCLYRAGRNRFLLDAARALSNSLLLPGAITYLDAERIDIVGAEHQLIIETLKARDAGAAGSAAEAHLQNSLRFRLKELSV